MTVDLYLGCDAGDNRAKPVMIATIPAQNECPGRDLNPHGSFEPGGFKFLEVVFTSPFGDLRGRIIPARSLGSVPPVP